MFDDFCVYTVDDLFEHFNTETERNDEKDILSAESDKQLRVIEVE